MSDNNSDSYRSNNSEPTDSPEKDDNPQTRIVPVTQDDLIAQEERRVRRSFPGAERVRGSSRAGHTIASADDDGTIMIGGNYDDDEEAARNIMALAELVNEPVVAAQVDADGSGELDEVKHQLKRQTCIGIVGGLVLLVAVVAFLAAFLVERGSDPEPSPTTSDPASDPVASNATTPPTPTASPTLATAAPSSSETTGPTEEQISPQEATYMRLIRSRLPSTTFEAGSPQRQALDWILQDSFTMKLNDDNRVVQRFALAVLYFSTDGSVWSLDSGEWLSSTTECGWGEADVACTDDDVVDWLSLGSDGLSGSIPAEIGLLSSLTLVYLPLNDLEGTIPTEIGLLSPLTLLHIYKTEIEGTIPSEIGMLSALTELWLYNNNLEGTIPSEIGLLTALNWFYISNNDNLAGSVPRELGVLPNLKGLLFHSTNLSGSIPSSLCNTLSDARIDCDEIECDCCTSNVYDLEEFTPCS